jgi:hypothetical protein
VTVTALLPAETDTRFFERAGMDHIKMTFTRLAKASPPLTEEKGDQIG